MDLKVALAIAASIISVIAYLPYFRGILNGKTKPHAFSWLIWSLVLYIAGFAQLKAGGGVGSAGTFITATLALAITALAFRDGSVTITKSDWASFIIALVAILVWVLTRQPLSSIIIVSFIDTAAFWPTLRKSYNAPFQENLSTHSLGILRDSLILVAQQKYNLVTVLYPVVTVITNIMLVGMLIARRTMLPD